MNQPSDSSSSPDAEDVRLALAAFRDLIERLEREERLTDAIPLLLKQLGNLRQMLFSYEVRTTKRLMPADDPMETASREVVKEALEREREMLREWELSWNPEEEEEDDDET